MYTFTSLKQHSEQMPKVSKK